MDFLKNSGGRFKWGLFFGWGVGIYAIMFLAWQLSILYHFTDGLVPNLARLALLIIVTFAAGRSLKFRFVSDILPYSAGWTLTAIALDALTALPSTGIALYTDWNIWVGYALVLLVPLLTHATHPAPQMPEVT